jgi:branched-subunit amino acid permease
MDPEQYLWMSLAAFMIDSILFPVVTLVLLFRVLHRLKSLERRLPG